MKSSSKIDVQSGMNTPLGVHHKDNQTQSRSNNDAYPSPVSPSKSDENGDYSTSYNGSSMYGNSLSQSSSSHSRNIHPFYKNFCVEAIKGNLLQILVHIRSTIFRYIISSYFAKRSHRLPIRCASFLGGQRIRLYSLLR